MLTHCISADMHETNMREATSEYRLAGEELVIIELPLEIEPKVKTTKTPEKNNIRKSKAKAGILSRGA